MQYVCTLTAVSKKGFQDRRLQPLTAAFNLSAIPPANDF
jgi:hypothetical protein